MGHGEINPAGGGSGSLFVIAYQTAAVHQPAEGAFDHPAFGQNDEAMGIAALDDLQDPRARACDDRRHPLPLVPGVGEDAFNERKGSPRDAQQVARAVAILHAGRMDHNTQQEAQRIDQDVALAAGDFLARIKALRVEHRAPF